MNRREFLEAMAGAAIAAMPLSELNASPNSAAFDLMTRSIYKNSFESIPGADTAVARQLFPLSLQDAHNDGFIPAYATDFRLPLGVTNGTKKVNFGQGMRDMWDAKIEGPLKHKENSAFRAKRNHFANRQRYSEPSNLLDYRKYDIAKGIDVLAAVHEGSSKSYGSRAEFMNTVIDTISPNVILGYNIHELFPSTIQGERVNAVAKTWFFDRLLREGGENMIEGYPARYDPQMSFGPFQMTDIPMKVITARNKYLPQENRVPNHVSQFRDLEDHINAATMLAHGNWNWMSKQLQGKHDARGKNLLNKFQAGFESLGKKEQQIIVAGLTACMHHQPGPTMDAVARYVSHENMNTMHCDIKKTLNPRLRKYYTSSAEAYLIMKVFDILENKYGTQLVK